MKMALADDYGDDNADDRDRKSSRNRAAAYDQNSSEAKNYFLFTLLPPDLTQAVVVDAETTKRLN